MGAALTRKKNTRIVQAPPTIDVVQEDTPTVKNSTKRAKKLKLATSPDQDVSLGIGQKDTGIFSSRVSHRSS